MPMETRISVVTGTSIRRILFENLFRANTEYTGDDKIEPLCVVARDTSGALVGGIFGEIYWSWLNIRVLWVAPASRREGLGSRLLARAEDEALARGCHGAFLDTFTFQNHGLYLRAGYQIFGTLEQFPNGHSRYFLRKSLHAV
jgi:GNAT superfamily N-acetyltransferase